MTRAIRSDRAEIRIMRVPPPKEGSGSHPHSLHVGDVLIDMRGCPYRIVSFVDCPSNEASFGANLTPIRLAAELSRTKACLTRRQGQIALLLANRATNAEIAAALGISGHTARHHSQTVLAKLGIGSRHLVRSRLVTAAHETTVDSGARLRSRTKGKFRK